MADLTVRPARPADVDDVLRIAEAGWHATYGDFLADETIEAAMEGWYDRERTRELVERDDVAYYVAEAGGEVLGYVNGGPGDDDADGEGGDVARLGAIYVHPDRWGEGIGTDLLARFESFCAEHGYDVIEFQVLAGNDVGASFYRKHGYEPVEERETELFGETVTDRLFRGTVD